MLTQFVMGALTAFTKLLNTRIPKIQVYVANRQHYYCFVGEIIAAEIPKLIYVATATVSRPDDQQLEVTSGSSILGARTQQKD